MGVGSLEPRAVWRYQVEISSFTNAIDSMPVARPRVNMIRVPSGVQVGSNAMPSAGSSVVIGRRFVPS